jgi:hypothetical protein
MKNMHTPTISQSKERSYIELLLSSFHAITNKIIYAHTNISSNTSDRDNSDIYYLYINID